MKRTFVLTDLHGADDLLFHFIEQVNFTSNDKMYILGDVLDRGPGSWEILNWIMKKKNVILLKGNHEDMFLDIIKNPTQIHERAFADYINENGMAITLLQYLGFSESMKNKYIKFLSELPIMTKIHRGKNSFVLSHAGVQFHESLTMSFENRMYSQPVDDYLWGREVIQDCFNNTYQFFGHTAGSEIKKEASNSYNLDTGACATDLLSFAEILDNGNFNLETFSFEFDEKDQKYKYEFKRSDV